MGQVRALVPTARQLAILRQKASGDTDPEVAGALAIGERTVRRQLDVLVEALGVRGRAELFIEVGRRGWLDTDEEPAVAQGAERPARYQLACFTP